MSCEIWKTDDVNTDTSNYKHKKNRDNIQREESALMEERKPSEALKVTSSFEDGQKI